MNRTVVTTADIARVRTTLGPEADDETEITKRLKQPTADDLTGRIVKYIPPDVIGAYVAIQGIISAANGQANGAQHSEMVAWLVFAVILIATPFYLRRVAHITKWKQIFISTIAFIVWAVAFPGLPFNEYVNPLYGSVALMLVTFLIPIVAD